MSLTAADVAEIMRVLEGSSFDEVVLEIDGLKLVMKRGAVESRADGAPAPASAPAPPIATPAVAPAAAPATTAPSVPPAPVDPNSQDVTSPLLGTSYRAPKPGAAPFVEVGSLVAEDTVVAIVEVMKLMNTVRAGVRGTVSEILMRDGALVEYGETLLRVRKAG